MSSVGKRCEKCGLNQACERCEAEGTQNLTQPGTVCGEFCPACMREPHGAFDPACTTKVHEALNPACTREPHEAFDPACTKKAHGAFGTTCTRKAHEAFDPACTTKVHGALGADRTVRRVALVGNPNVGKSTVFNTLTGLRQHTGNWAGVTVSCAFGSFSVSPGKDSSALSFSIVDLPGIYSFDVRSEEEAATKRFVENEIYDFLLLICDSTCPERGLCLLRQVTDIVKDRKAEELPQFILCMNLWDEAARKGIQIDLALMEQELGIPVVPCCGRTKKGVQKLREALAKLCAEDCYGDCPVTGNEDCSGNCSVTGYDDNCGNYSVTGNEGYHDNCSVTGDDDNSGNFPVTGNDDNCGNSPVTGNADCCGNCFVTGNVGSSVDKCGAVCHCCSRLPSAFSPAELAGRSVTYTRKDHRKREERLDRLLTGPFTGMLLMCLMLTGIFWLTIVGANYPSELLWSLFFSIEKQLSDGLASLGAAPWFINMSISGVYRAVAWIVSVMLPPMAIFFPLFTLLEDLGYLPRAAFNMDGAFQRCHACGKQCLTMAMGLGCNAAGVTGCRIIDSPRERLIAILTNSLVPCNGRFPLLLTMISLMVGTSAIGAAATIEPTAIESSVIESDTVEAAAIETATIESSVIESATVETAATESATIESSAIGASAFFSSALRALLLTGFLLLGVFMTFAVSWLLSHTLLKGVPSSFTLELPPYRRPQLGRIIVRSVFDRTLFVLFRAVSVAAPAGLLIWLLANISVNDVSLLLIISGFLEPFGRFIGLDGVILMAFILAFPANEIVLPIILMAYLQNNALVPMDDMSGLSSLLAAHGWTLRTVICMSVFTLFHWPCSTTCLTIRKETGSLKWTVAAFLLPTAVGVLLCSIIS